MTAPELVRFHLHLVPRGVTDKYVEARALPEEDFRERDWEVQAVQLLSDCSTRVSDELFEVINGCNCWCWAFLQPYGHHRVKECSDRLYRLLDLLLNRACSNYVLGSSVYKLRHALQRLIRRSQGFP